MKTKVKYPHLSECLRTMFLDNCGGLYHDCILPEDQWKWPKNVDVLEAQASTLTKVEKETFTCGEETEMLALQKSKKLGKLSKFLNQVFDGPLTFNFQHNDMDN